MSRSRSEVPGNGEPTDGFEIRPPMSLQQRLAHVYDGSLGLGRPSVLANESGRVIPGVGGLVRDATFKEISRAMDGQSINGQSLPQVDADWAALKADREARRDAARKLKGGRRSA